MAGFAGPMGLIALAVLSACVPAPMPLVRIEAAATLCVESVSVDAGGNLIIC